MRVASDAHGARSFEPPPSRPPPPGAGGTRGGGAPCFLSASEVRLPFSILGAKSKVCPYAAFLRQRFRGSLPKRPLFGRVGGLSRTRRWLRGPSYGYRPKWQGT